MNDVPLSLQGFSAALGKRKLFGIDSFQPERGSSLAIIGKTGAGKSVLLRSLAGLLPSRPFELGGSMRIHGIDAYADGRKTGYAHWRRIRRAGLVFVPAESAQAMNPSLTLRQNLALLAPEAEKTVERRLEQYFRIDFGACERLYPDEVSGGELQRVTIMMLLSRSGDLILLDEPTVNLDRDLRRRFIEFLNAEILTDRKKTVLMASHDLDFVRALRMDGILALEDGALKPLAGLPENGGFRKAEAKAEGGDGIELSSVTQHYPIRGIFGEREFYAFRDLDIGFKRSVVYGVTGPSGCGKTSMIRAILRLIDGTSGAIELDGKDLVALKPREKGSDPAAFAPFRRKMAIVQQDSRFAFFPDLKIKDSFRQIVASRGGSPDAESAALEAWMGKVALSPRFLDAHPRSLSSGEMKRMDIARALAAEPEVILLDEPFAHIDFETRSAVMRAISEYLAERQVVIIVVTHEEFDLKYFIEKNYDFLSLAGGKKAASAPSAKNAL